MPTVPFLGSYGDISGSGLMFRNKLINGGFDIWQRATSQTGSAIGSADRWNNQNAGSTKTTSRQAFTLGQTDVPGNPTYFCRTVVSSVAGSGNYCSQSQAIESVTTLAGATATLSFWAKADAAKNIAIELQQYFGSGGSPSATVNGIGVTTFSLTTSWKYFTVTVTIPSISGKVLGTNNNDFVGAVFWFDAGSNFNARTNSLGQQSGTFDIANVQLEAGPVATPFEQRPIGTELALCMRYYQQYRIISVMTRVGGGTEINIFIRPIVPFRASAGLSISLANGDYTVGSPSGNQWTMFRPGVGYSIKTGTVSWQSDGNLSFQDGSAITSTGATFDSNAVSLQASGTSGIFANAEL